MYIRFSLRGMLRQIRIDTLRRDNKVGFLAGRLICRNVFKRRLLQKRQEVSVSGQVFHIHPRFAIIVFFKEKKSQSYVNSIV